MKGEKASEDIQKRYGYYKWFKEDPKPIIAKTSFFEYLLIGLTITFIVLIIGPVAKC